MNYMTFLVLFGIAGFIKSYFDMKDKPRPQDDGSSSYGGCRGYYYIDLD